jgi:recombination associated protein RdgC
MMRFLRGIFMWFRNLQLYRLGQTLDLSPEVLNERLQEQAFRGCSRMDMAASGWVPPLGRHSELLVHAADACIMLCLRKGEKIIPAGVVNQLLDDRVAGIEVAEAREVYRRERRRLKDEIIVDLLPRALTRHTDLFAYIDSRNGLVVVDTPTASKAEDLISQLRTTLGTFKATPLEVNESASGAMTRWLNGAPLPGGFELGDTCELKHPDPAGGQVTIKGQDLGAGEVRNHLNHGKYAVKLALIWKERLSFVLQDDLSIKRLKFEDVIRDAEGDTTADDFASRFDLDFSLMTLELAAFLPQLLGSLGGEALPEAA